MNRIDRKIPELIQEDATLLTSEIAERVGLNTTLQGGVSRTWKSAV